MGLTVYLDDELGRHVEGPVYDDHLVLHALLPPITDSSFQLLRFVDWYQETGFNQPQMDQFLEELTRIRSKAKAAEEKRILTQIKWLAHQCKKRDNTYLRFYGE